MLEPGDVPVFWACGVTPQAAVMASKPEFAITHAPGHMFITSKRDLNTWCEAERQVAGRGMRCVLRRLRQKGRRG